MMEQCIYSRADNDYINGNGQRIGVGYGRMANSQGYLALPSNVQDTLTSYPGPVPDLNGRFPKVLSMYGLGTGGDAVQVLQQVTYLSSSSRDLHVGHQYAAQGDAGVYDMVVEPRAWMQLFFEDRTNTIDYPVRQCEKLPAEIPFDMGTLPEVLKYFSMKLSHFEILLCSLFEVLRYESLFTLITVDDSKPDYQLWVRRLIAHIYMFLPLSMRRQVGFESWFTGRTLSGRVKLQFTGQSRLIADGHRRYVRIVRARVKYDYDVTSCVLFAGGSVRFVPDQNCPMDITRVSSYRRFIRPWLERATSQDGLRLEQQLNRYWQIFDTAPDGKDACGLDDFENLITYEDMRRGTVACPEMEALPAFAADFYSHMGGYGGKLIAKRLIERLSDTGIDTRTVDLLIDLSEEEKFGPELAGCAASYLCGDRLGDTRVDIPHLQTLMHMVAQGRLSTDPETYRTLIGNAYSAHQGEGGAPLWEDIRALLRIETWEGLAEDAGEAVMSLCVRLLPERFTPAEAADALGDALALPVPERVRGFVEAYLERVEPDIEWTLDQLEGLLRQCEPARTDQLCKGLTDRLLAANAPDLGRLVDLLETLCLLHDESLLSHQTLEEIAQSAVGRCAFDARDGGAVAQGLTRIMALSKDYGFSGHVARDVLSGLLENQSISLARKLAILRECMPDSLEDPVLLDYMQDCAGRPLAHDEVLPFAKAALPLAEGRLRTLAEELLRRSLEDYAPEANETVPLVEALSHYSAEVRSGFRAQLLNALGRGTEMDVFAASEALLSGFEADAAAAEAARLAMERAVETWPMDDAALDHIIACAGLVEGGQAVFAPLWQRALERYPEGAGNRGAVDVIASLRKVGLRLSQTLPDWSGITDRALEQFVENGTFSIPQSAALVRDVFSGWQQEGLAFARTVVSRLAPDADEAQALVTLARALLQAWPGEETFAMCERLLPEALGEGDASLESLGALLTLMAGRLDAAPEALVRAVISAVGRRGDRRVPALCALARFEAADDVFPDRPARAAAKQLVREKPVSVAELQAMEAAGGEDGLGERPLYRKVRALMVKGLELPEGEGTDGAFRVLLPLLNNPSEKLSEAARETVLRLLERGSVSNLEPFLQAAEAWRGEGADAMLSVAVARLDGNAGLRVAMPQLIRICDWPDLAGAWPRTRAAIPEAAGRVLRQVSLHDGIALIESCAAPELRGALVQALVEKSAESAAAAQGFASGPFAISYGVFPSETEALESLLQDCRAVQAGLEASDDADRIICNLYECMGYACIEDLPAFLDALLGLPAPLPETVSPPKDAPREERFAFYDAIGKVANNRVSLRRGQAADMLIQMAVERNPEGFSSFSNICDGLARWLLAFPVNGLKPDDACVEALLRAIQIRVNRGGIGLLGEENWPLFALIEKGGDGTREVAIYLCGELIRGKLTQSYQTMKSRGALTANGKGLYRRVVQLTGGVRDGSERLRLIVSCVYEMEATNSHFSWYFFADYLNSDNVVKLVGGELEGAAFDAAASSLMRRLLAFIVYLDKVEPGAASRLSDDMGRACRKYLKGTVKGGYLSAEWMSRILWTGHRELGNIRLDPALLTRWVGLIFSNDNAAKTELNNAFSRSVFEPTLSDALRAANEKTPGALLYYLQWRLELCRWYTITQAASGEKIRIEELFRFLNINNRRRILEGWHSLLNALTPRLEQDIYKTIGRLCSYYVDYANNGLTLNGFALLFPQTLMEIPIARFGEFQVETAAVMAATELYELGEDAFKKAVKRLNDELSPENRREFQNFDNNRRLRAIRQFYIKRPLK